MTRLPLETLHTPIVLSDDPEAKYSPSGENATLYTEEEWPFKLLTGYPLKTLHTTISLRDPDAINSPLGENTTLYTELEFPFKILILSPLDTLHKLIVQSADPEAKNSPSGENTTLQT